MDFISLAYAMGGAPQQAGGDAAAASGAGAFMQFVPLILMLVIFYFLLIRPQQKRAKEHKLMLDGLKTGDQVLTNGGIMGRIVATDGDILTLNIAKGVDINVGRGYIVGPLDSKAKEAKEK